MPVVGPPMPITDVYTYEEGTDGAVVATGNDIDAVDGSPVYAASAAASGNLGVNVGGSVYSAIYYPAFFPQTGSLYIKRGPETPTGRIAIINFYQGTTAGVSCGGIGILKTGQWALMDGSASATILTQSTYTTSPGEAFRADWQTTYDGTNLNMEARFFTGANIQGTTADETLTASVAAASTPDHVKIGSYAATTIGIDTLRLWNDTSAWPDPYVAAAPSYVITVWDGTQEVAVSSVTVWDGTQELAASIDSIQG